MERSKRSCRTKVKVNYSGLDEDGSDNDFAEASATSCKKSESRKRESRIHDEPSRCTVKISDIALRPQEPKSKAARLDRETKIENRLKSDLQKVLTASLCESSGACDVSVTSGVLDNSVVIVDEESEPVGIECKSRLKTAQQVAPCPTRGQKNPKKDLTKVARAQNLCGIGLEDSPGMPLLSPCEHSDSDEDAAPARAERRSWGRQGKRTHKSDSDDDESEERVIPSDPGAPLSAAMARPCGAAGTSTVKRAANKWTPPASMTGSQSAASTRAGGAKIGATPRLALSPSVSSGGLRVGLSKMTRLKPLHPLVHSK